MYGAKHPPPTPRLASSYHCTVLKGTIIMNKKRNNIIPIAYASVDLDSDATIRSLLEYIMHNKVPQTIEAVHGYSIF